MLTVLKVLRATQKNILKPVRTAIERAKETQKKNSLTAYLQC